jgi:enoyl-CoA hydratase/carnithine racemase
MTQNMPEGFVHEDQLIFGMRKDYPGLFEIKIHNPKKKNAIAGIPEEKMTKLVLDAQDNEDIKVILLHGGSYFSSGNDLGAFAEFAKKGDMEKMMSVAEHGVNTIMVNMLLAFSKSVKPIVAVVRGGSMGIGFTLLAHTTFLYCSPESYFMTPFM